VLNYLANAISPSNAHMFYKYDEKRDYGVEEPEIFAVYDRIILSNIKTSLFIKLKCITIFLNYSLRQKCVLQLCVDIFVHDSSALILTEYFRLFFHYDLATPRNMGIKNCYTFQAGDKHK
jgi:hypothetical protein